MGDLSMSDELTRVLRKFECYACEKVRRPLFQFPKEKEKVKLWLEHLGIERTLDYDFKYFQKRAKLCTMHFDDSAFTSNRKNRLRRSHVLPKRLPPWLASKLSANKSDEKITMKTCEPSASNSDTSSEVQLHEILPYIKTEIEIEEESNNSFEIPSLLEDIPEIAIMNVRSVENFKRKKGLDSRSRSLLKKLSDTLNPMQYDFVLSLVRNSLKQKGKNRRWTREEMSFVVEIYHRSFSAYKLLRKYLAFPKISSIKRSINIVRSPGFCPKLASCLHQLVSKMGPKDRFCTLTFHEMPIRKVLSYNFGSDSIDGFETRTKCPQPASKALVFMLRGISKNWKQVLGYYFLPDCERRKERVMFLYQALKQAVSCGLTVIAVVCDRSAPNQALIADLLGTTKVPFFMFNERKVFVIWDPPHLLKSVRNTLQSNRIWFLCQNEKETGFASWKHIRQLFEVDSKQKYSLCQKLTQAHVKVTSKNKRNFKLASEILSYSVAAALHFYALSPVFKVDTEAVQTAEFVGRVDKIFGSLNSRDVSSSEPLSGAVKEDSGHVEFWSDTIKFIESWRVLSPDRKIIPSPLQTGWISTLKAFIGLWSYLKEEGFEFLLLSRFNMNCLVDTFGSLRRRFQCNLDCRQFSQAIHEEAIRNFTRKSPLKSLPNDSGDALLDFGKLNRSSLTAIIDDKEESGKLADYKDFVVPNEIFEEENFLLYVSDFIAKEYCKVFECEECKSLITSAKALDDTKTVIVYLQEFGLNRPSEEFVNYIKTLNDSFTRYFNFRPVGTRRQMMQKLFDLTIFDLFEKHIKHREVARTFFIEMFTNIMIIRNIYIRNKLFKTF